MEIPPPKSALSETLLAETQHLQAAWQRHDARFLDTYLVQDVEDPRINIQSILTRHFLIRGLFQDRYAAIMEHELYYALLIHWLLGLLKSQQPRHDVHMQLSTILDELLIDSEKHNSSAVPAFITDAFKKLTFPNYVSNLLMWVPRDDDDALMPAYLLNTFERIWAETLAGEQASPLRVIEPACGSANDYRFLERYGLGRFLHYTGFDLCAKNIRNAKNRFPAVDFRVGSVFEIQTDDKTYDTCFVHDLFEHLSPEGISRAVAEISRVTTRKACLHFFNMAEMENDVIEKKDDYYWNRLSVESMRKRFGLPVACIESHHLLYWLNACFVYPHYYNKYAYTWQIHFEPIKTERSQ